MRQQGERKRQAHLERPPKLSHHFLDAGQPQPSSAAERQQEHQHDTQPEQPAVQQRMQQIQP